MTLALIFETTLRTVLIAALAGLGLAIFRVRSSTIKLAVWRVVLYASLLMPFVSLTPKRAIVLPLTPAPVVRILGNASTRLDVARVSIPVSESVDWSTLALRSYALVTGLLLLRALLGLFKLRQLGIDANAMPELGPEVFETPMIKVPVTYGVRNARILLPIDWRNWTNETLGAVLAHERAHIAERDFLTQCLSKINRALYWTNPLVWWLDRQLALLAEHSSDDAALSYIAERPAYAAMLLGFAGRRSDMAAAGVAMARNGSVAGRIDRVLDEARLLSQPLSPGIRFALAACAFVAVVGIGTCKMSTVSAQTNPPKPPRTERTEIWWNDDRSQTQWVLVTPHGTTMNGTTDFLSRAKSLKNEMRGSDYLLFIQNGKTFLIDDSKTIAEIEEWFKPMEELGRLQGELGEKQGVLGEQMGKLGEEMGKLGEQMSHVKVTVPDMKKLTERVEELRKLEIEAGRLQKELSIQDLTELQNRLGEMQSLIGEARSLAGEKQSHIGELQSKLGEQQALLGEKQGKLGEEQGRLGEQQGKMAEEADKKLRRLFDQAIQDGRAKPVK